MGAYLATLGAVEPGVDAVLLALEVTGSSLYVDVDGSRTVYDVSNVLGHVNTARLTAIVVSACTCM